MTSCSIRNGDREKRKRGEKQREKTQRRGERARSVQTSTGLANLRLIRSVTIDEEIVQEESKFVIVRLHAVVVVTNFAAAVAFSLRRCSLHVNRLFLFVSRVLANCAS